MKTKAIIVIVIGLVLFGIFSMPIVRQKISHVKSATIGLERRVTLYANDGTTIRTWRGRYQIGLYGGSGSVLRFMHDGRAVQISGTIIIEEVE